MGNPSSVKTPIISIVGLSGSGKTTLMEKLIKILSQRGLKVATIKHSSHPHLMDAPGKDSWRHKNAGAERVIFIGPKAIQFVSNIKNSPSPASLAKDYLNDMDIVLVEGFGQSDTEKIEVIRGECSHKPVFKPEDGLIAIATDIAPERFLNMGVEVFNLNDAEKIADFIESNVATARKGESNRLRKN